VTVSEGDRIDLGGLEVNIMETPGHSSCSISAYVPQLKALFPSDGGGIPFKETIVISANSNFARFQESLDRLNECEVDYVCADHYGYVAGEEAKSYMQQSIEAAKQLRASMEQVYRRTGDVEEATRVLVSSFYMGHKDYLLSPEILHGIYHQMVRHIAKAMDVD
jgi:glyoxylase-like metal-dependent hydrolase (beta-lactamase superfamily II)